MRTVLAGASLVALAACAPDPLAPSGGAADLLPNGFGNATMNNVLVQSGQMPFAVELSSRFAAEVPTTITFAFNSDTLDAAARAALDRQAAFINAFPEVRFAVFGHTDLVGSSGYNYELGLRRARAAVAYLVSRGVDAGRLEALVSEGETQPIVATPGPERANRRTVTDVRGFVQGHPNVLDGRYAQIIHREYVGSAVPMSTLANSPTSPGALPSGLAGIPATEGVAGGGGANGGSGGGG